MKVQCPHCGNFVDTDYKYKVGDLVLISEDLDHDIGYRGQLGVVTKVTNMEKYYYVTGWDARVHRYWACGMKEDEIISLGQNITGLLDAYNTWIKN